MIGRKNWITATPALPPAAFRPSAVPFLLVGKKKLMLAIEEAKLPPPKPAVAAIATNTQNGVSGRCTKYANNSVGMTSSPALTTVQLRPPTFGTAKVYGSRSSEPTRLGTATSQNSCWGVKSNPAPASRAALTLQSSHTEKPRCSAKIENARLRRATRRPVASQKSGFSGVQCSIQPRRGAAWSGGLSTGGAEADCVS